MPAVPRCDSILRTRQPTSRGMDRGRLQKTNGPCPGPTAIQGTGRGRLLTPCTPSLDRSTAAQTAPRGSCSDPRARRDRGVGSGGWGHRISASLCLLSPASRGLGGRRSACCVRRSKLRAKGSKGSFRPACGRTSSGSRTEPVVSPDAGAASCNTVSGWILGCPPTRRNALAMRLSAPGRTGMDLEVGVRFRSVAPCADDPMASSARCPNS
jgi:hypothetical protein